MSAPALEPAQESWNIEANDVAAAFYHDSIGGDGEADVENAVEKAIHACAVGWMRARQAEINAVERLRGPKVLVGHDFAERRDAGCFERNNGGMPVIQQHP